MECLLISALVPVSLLVAALGLTVALGGPSDLPPLASINNPFKSVDFSDLPPTRVFAARDGTNLAFRAYPATGTVKGSVALVHGSSADSSSLHVMAKGFAATGYAAYALDMRGQGQSGVKGQIAYVGQLEDDVADFARAAKPALLSTLGGFSSGGGFVLRFAGSRQQRLFSHYLLLPPSSVRTPPRRERGAAAGSAWACRASWRSPCSTVLACACSTACP